MKALNKERYHTTKSYLMFLDYFNNFLSVERWCEYYGITQSTGNRIRKLYHSF